MNDLFNNLQEKIIQQIGLDTLASNFLVSVFLRWCFLMIVILFFFVIRKHPSYWEIARNTSVATILGTTIILIVNSFVEININNLDILVSLVVFSAILSQTLVWSKYAQEDKP